MNAPDAEARDVKVSVAMVTYNHEPFIAQAIESVLMQQTEFGVDLIIGEDCSTDGTREIVTEYARRHPERIRPLWHEHNVGAQANFVAVLNACRGQYIAALEGDDYWTDPRKLQRQVDFLEAHPECALCFHKAVVVAQDDIHLPRFKPQNSMKTIIDLDYLLGEANFAPTCSVMLRNGLVTRYPEWFYTLPVGDWALLVLNAQFGKIGYLDEVMSVYRSHSEGVFSRQTPIQKHLSLLTAREIVGSHVSPQHQRRIAVGISRIYLGLSAAYADEGEIPTARKYLVKSIRMNPLSFLDRTLVIFVMIGRLYVPRVYMLLRSIQAYRSEREND